MISGGKPFPKGCSPGPPFQNGLGMGKGRRVQAMADDFGKRLEKATTWAADKIREQMKHEQARLNVLARDLRSIEEVADKMAVDPDYRTMAEELVQEFEEELGKG